MNNTKDMVSHPAHYQSETGLEVIDVIEAFTSKLTGVEAFDTGNIIKYICRWHEKNGLEDLEKARWYLNDLIDHVKHGNPPNTTDVYFAEREKVEKCIESMRQIIETYGVVTVADLYEIAHLNCDYTCDNWGWVNLEKVDILKVRDGYTLKLPKPYKIN